MFLKFRGGTLTLWRECVNINQIRMRGFVQANKAKLKILHLFSDWRWTGPAEPVLQMCQGLQGLGHHVLLAYRRPQAQGVRSLDDMVRGSGIHATDRFHLDRYMNPGNTISDLRQLPRLMRRERFDVLHMHLSHDHFLGALCAKMVGKATRPLMVRTLHKRDVLKPTCANRWLMRHLSDGYLTFTEGFRREYIKRFGLPPSRIVLQPMTVDLARFDPDRSYQNMRGAFGIPPEAPLIGIVGRFQRYRKMDLFLKAAKILLQERPDTFFLVIGRSSQMQQTVVRPLHELGIAKRVVLAGYRDADYEDTLACLDIFSLLMPGSDGTARAVREALSLGKPCVVSDYYMLPEIVRHEKTGLVVSDDPKTLADAWLCLIRDKDKRDRMGQAARKYTQDHFNITAVGPALSDFYRHIISFYS